MLGRLLGHDVAYLRMHFREHSDARMAKALGVSKERVLLLRESHGLKHSREETERIKKQPDIPLPPYRAQAPVPEDPATLDQRSLFSAAFVFLAAIAVYLRTLPPTVTGEDSGEFIAAAYTMGIAHPPGYPLWCILGKLFTFIPYGTVAWRINFMSAFFGALACAVVYLIAYKLCRRHLPAIAASLALAFSLEFWMQSLIAEVYSLNAFLIAMCILLLLTWYESRRDVHLYAFAFVFGLGLSNHNTMVLLGPVFGLFVLSIDPECWRRWKVYAGCTVLALVTTGLIHLYLPIRAMADPPMNWGDPSNWENFWAVVTRAQYSFMFTEEPRTILRFLRQTWMLGGMYAEQFTPWAALLPLLGIPPLLRLGWRRAVFVGLLAVFLSFGYILVLNTKFEQESMWVATVFYIPFYMIAAILMALALGVLQQQASRLSRLGPARAAVVPVLGAGLIALPVLTHWERNDRAEDYWTLDYALNLLHTMEENAIYFPAADHATFPVIYLQMVEGMRPDILIANKYGYPDWHLYEDMPEPVRSRFSRIPTLPEERLIEEWIIQQHPERPVYFSTPRSYPRLQEHEVVPVGLLFRLIRPGEEAPERDWFAEYQWTTLDPAALRGDYTNRLILGDLHAAKARNYFQQGDTDAALAQLDEAAEILGEAKETLNNFGSLCAENGAFDAARDYFKRANALDPDYATPLKNIAKVALQTGQPNDALQPLADLQALLSDDVEVLWLAVDAYQRTRHIDAALTALERLEQRTPRDPRVHRELGMIYLRHIRDPIRAREHFHQSLRLDPDQPDLHSLLADTQQPRERSPQQPGITPPALPDIPGLPTLPTAPGVPGGGGR